MSKNKIQNPITGYFCTEEEFTMAVDAIYTDKIHIMKSESKFFWPVFEDVKTWEFRINDRNFKKGDFLWLREWNGSEYTGSSVIVKVLDVSIGIIEQFLDCQQSAYVLLSIQVWSKIDERIPEDAEQKELTL